MKSGKYAAEARYKCPLCEEAFDDEEQRDLHAAIEPHCEKCGTKISAGIRGRALCRLCLAEKSFDSKRENDSVRWH